VYTLSLLLLGIIQFDIFNLLAELNSRWAVTESARIQITAAAIRQTQGQNKQNTKKNPSVKIV
jgi:hypothetical protein